MLAAVGLLLRLAFALLPLSAHLVILEDDAWMVTTIARNFALGQGITADGVNTTNGFQPLYPLTLGALPYLVAPDALDFGFTANLVMCALLNTLVMWPLWWLARHFGGEMAGLLGVALFALNPNLIRNSINGMETSLGLLLFLTLFVAFYKLDFARVRNVLLLAVLTALAVLARLDASLAFAAITLTLLLRVLTNRNAQAIRRLGLIGLYVTVTMVLLVPYFAFNQIVSESFSPSSGAALAYMQSYAGSFNITNGVQGIRQNSAIYLYWLTSPTIVILMSLVLVGLVVWLLGRRLWLAFPMLCYLPIPLLYYGYLLQQARDRYFVAFSAIVIVLLAWCGAEVLRRWPQRTTTFAVAGVVVMLVVGNTYRAFDYYQGKRTEAELTQPISYQAALWIRDNLPEDAVIGAKNSGIYQYYSGRTVVNIDGKLNHEMIPVMEQRMMLPYLRESGVQYLVDRKQVMERHVSFYSAELGDAPYHRTPTLLERIEIYGKIAANRLGANLPLHIDEGPTGFTASRPFSDVATIIQEFDRANERDNPVVVYQLKPEQVP